MWGISEQVSISLSATPHQKVLNWLETTNDKAASPPLQEDVEYMNTPVNSQELISVSQDPDRRHLNDNDNDNLQELFLPRVKTTSIKRKKKTAK